MSLTVSHVLRNIAADIENNGHFKAGEGVTLFDLYQRRSNPTGPCCLIANPTQYKVAEEDQDVSIKANLHMVNISQARGFFGLTDFSDNTPTEELCAILRQHADELEQREAQAN